MLEQAGAGAAGAVAGQPELEVSVVIPCLDEAETLAGCVREAREALASAGAAGEVLVADNGSTDGSRALAQAEGARVVEVPARGYGNGTVTYWGELRVVVGR